MSAAAVLSSGLWFLCRGPATAGSWWLLLDFGMEVSLLGFPAGAWAGLGAMTQHPAFILELVRTVYG